MPARTYELVLTGFEFPSKLPDRKANFRLLADLRYISRRGEHTTAHAVLPGLDSWWECDPGRKDRLEYVRGDHSGKRVRLDMARVDDWQRLILLVRGDGVHSIQLRVFDVNRSDPWDRMKAAVTDIIPPLLGRGQVAVPDLEGIFTDSLGSAAADLESFALARLAGGDSLLFRGSTSLVAPGGFEILGGGVSGNYRISFDLNEME